MHPQSFTQEALDSRPGLTHAKIIHQSSAVRFFKITKRLMSRPTTKMVANTKVMVVTTKTVLLEDPLFRSDDILAPSMFEFVRMNVSR
jgi:hypothetical protein